MNKEKEGTILEFNKEEPVILEDDKVFVIKIISGELLVAVLQKDGNYTNPHILVWIQEKSALLLMPYPTPNEELTKGFVIYERAVIGIRKPTKTILDVYKEMTSKVKIYKTNPLEKIQ